MTIFIVVALITLMLGIAGSIKTGKVTLLTVRWLILALGLSVLLFAGNNEVSNGIFWAAVFLSTIPLFLEGFKKFKRQ